MSTYQMNPSGDYRSEGWGFVGSFSTLNQAWSSVSDSNYATCPGNKGRAAVSFPIDLTNGNIPYGSNMESVTVSVRAANTDSVSNLTVNVLSTDDTGKFTQRTIPLTTTPTTYQVGTYTVDPVRSHWDRDRLNRLIVQVFSYSGNSANVRVYQVFVTVNYRTAPTLTVTSPTGTVPTAAPTLSWVYTQTDGDPQKSAQYKIFTAAQVALASFNPDTTPSAYPVASTYKVKEGDSLFKIAAEKLGDGNLWPSIYADSTLRSGDPNLIFPGEIVNIPGIGTVTGDVSSIILPFGLAAGTYYAYVKVTSTHGCVSPWAFHNFTVAGSSPGSPGGSLGGIGTGGGGGFESVIADPVTSNVFLTLVDGSNLLGTQEADFETLTDALGWTGSNCVLAQDLTVSYGSGGASMSMKASSAATMSASSDWVEVAPASAITARAQFQAVATGRSITINVLFWDQNFASVSGTLTASGTDVTAAGGGFTELVVTGNTPNSVVYATVQLVVTSPANNEVHNVDHIGLMYGTNAAWSNGGHASRNLLTESQSSADDPIGAHEPWAALDSGTTYSRVSTTGTGSSGGKCFKMLYGSAPTSVSFVSTSSASSWTASQSTFTLNKPASTLAGDVLIAYIGTSAGTANVPSGWSLVDSQSNGNGGNLTVLMRDATGSDPSTWSGTLTSAATLGRTFVEAYRGAAATAFQFTAENMQGGNVAGATLFQTPTVNNIAGGAWRLSCFNVQASAVATSTTANITPPSTVGPISYVGKGGVDKRSGGTSFTVNKPTGVVSGDLMIAAICYSDMSGTITAPTGWTLLMTTTQSLGFASPKVGVMYRFAGGSEPSSWSGSSSSSCNNYVCQAVAYRNVDSSTPFLAHSGQADGAATYSTPVINNTSSKAWGISIFGNTTEGGSSTSSNDVIERGDNTNSGIDASANLAIYDSNGTISTGNRQITAVASNDLDLYGSLGILLTLKQSTAASSPGANETSRGSGTVGSGPSLIMSGFDSNAVAATGLTTVYETYTGTGTVGYSAFLGFLLPGTTSVNGECGINMVDQIDISHISSDVRSRAGNQVTVQAAFLGSSAGVSHLKLFSYVGAELVSTQVAETASFGTTTWTKAITQFSLVPGTTRLQMGVSAIDRNSSDYVLMDRASISLGSSSAYRHGTGLSAHPVFDVPLIEFQEDLGTGYGDWTALPGTVAAQLTYDNLSGVCTYIDQAVTPLSARQYRARTRSYGLTGDVFISPYGPVSSEVTMQAQSWWLKDFQDPGLSLQLKVYQDGTSGAFAGPGNVGVSKVDAATQFQPLGADLPVVISDGYKGDQISLTCIVEGTDYAQLIQTLTSGHTFLLQSNLDKAWWVRPIGNITNVIQPTFFQTSNPMRFVGIVFLEVAPED